MGKSKTKKATELFQVSNHPTGPWDGSPKWTTREAVLAQDNDFDNEVAAFLDDDGTESNWYVKHPDGRVEIFSYGGEHVGWHS